MYEKLNEAIKFATDCHAGQTRKFSNAPYILHPLEVAAIIGSISTDEDLIIAGLLHDTMEDCHVEARLIKEKFGSRVAALVQSESEDKLSNRPPQDTWVQRKEESLLLLEHTKSLEVKILWLADKLSNMRSFYREHLKNGDEIWKALNQKDPKLHAWYYKTIASLVTELSHTAAYAEYVDLLNKVFG